MFPESIEERRCGRMETTNDLFSMILDHGQPSQETFFLVLSKMKEHGQLEQVVRESQKALTVFPQDIQIRQLLAETYLEMGQVVQAEEEMERVSDQIGTFMSAYKFQARVYHSQGKIDKAIQALKLYLTYYAEDQEALQLMTSIQPVQEIGPTAEALEEAEPSSRKGLLEIATPTLAEIYFDQGQLSEAIEIYEKVVYQNPEDTPSKQRLEDLKAMAQAEEKVAEERERVVTIRNKKEKMLTILEAWRANIRENLGSPSA
jgi:tetratricopeptide (TPR) repeat protein